MIIYPLPAHWHSCMTSSIVAAPTRASKGPALLGHGPPQLRNLLLLLLVLCHLLLKLLVLLLKLLVLLLELALQLRDLLLGSLLLSGGGGDADRSSGWLGSCELASCSKLINNGGERDTDLWVAPHGSSESDLGQLDAIPDNTVGRHHKRGRDGGGKTNRSRGRINSAGRSSLWTRSDR